MLPASSQSGSDEVDSLSELLVCDCSNPCNSCHCSQVVLQNQASGRIPAMALCRLPDLCQLPQLLPPPEQRGKLSMHTVLCMKFVG